jgi:vacuolar protein sorting-associated protein VTA1
LTLGPDDNLHLEGFASSVFAKADKQDRAGRADMYYSELFLLFFNLFAVSLMRFKQICTFCRNTAKTFYAASIFFEILSQFGELQPDVSVMLISSFMTKYLYKLDMIISTPLTM